MDPLLLVCTYPKMTIQYKQYNNLVDLGAPTEWIASAGGGNKGSIPGRINLGNGFFYIGSVRVFWVMTQSEFHCS